MKDKTIQPKTVVREDKKLLAACGRIFGDLVVNAYVTTYQYSMSKKDEVAQRLDMSSKRIAQLNTGSDLHYDAEDIMVEFSNGTRVIFGNSEWASIRKVTDFITG